MFEKLVNIICNYVEVEPENIHPDFQLFSSTGLSQTRFLCGQGEPWRHNGRPIHTRRS